MDFAAIRSRLAGSDGRLYCLVEDGGRLAVERAHPIQVVSSNKVIADCAFDERGRLVVGSNLFDLDRVYRVDGWRDPATATVTPIAPIGVGFAETLAVRGDVIYRMSDTGGAPSMMARYRCP
jgi:hypothetical protein